MQAAPARYDAAVQAALTRCDAAVQAVASRPALAVASAVPAPALTLHRPAVQAAPAHAGPDGPLQVLLRQIQGGQYVTDTFCPDRDYLALEKKNREGKRKTWTKSAE